MNETTRDEFSASRPRETASDSGEAGSTASSSELAAELDELEAEASTPELEAAPAASGDQASDVSTADALALLLRPAFDLLAPAWAVSDAECKALADAWGAVLDKYWPDLQVGVELNAALVTAVVLGPRLRRPRFPAPAPAAAEPAAEPAPGS